MPSRPDAQALMASICDLAMEIARLCPDAAERGEQLVALVGELRQVPVDRDAVEDAITSRTMDSDLSESQVRSTTEAVIKAARGSEE